MLSQAAGKVFRSNGLLFQTIVACAAGLILGVSSLWIAPLRIMGALVAAACVYAVLKRPELALLGILIATSSIIFEDQLPLLSVGVGSLHVSDILLLGLLGLIVLRWFSEPGFKIVRTPLDWPLLIFYGLMVLSTLIAILHSSIGVEEGRRGLRVLTYYLTFFVVTNLLRERRQLNLLVNGLFLLATIVATAMILQYFFGSSLRFLPGRVETLVTQGTGYKDVTRIIPPGWSVVMVSGVAVFCISIQERLRMSAFLRYLQLGFLGFAIVITFMRAYWAALLFVILLSVFLVRGIEKQRFLGWCMLVLFMLGTVFLYGSSEPQSQVGKLVGATYSRLATLWSTKTAQEGSLQWRYVENQYAIRSIVSHPLLGLGFGAPYRPYDPRLDSPGLGWDATSYIHNGHLSILVDSGLLGYLAFAGLSLTYIIRGFRYWHIVAVDSFRGVVLGFTLVYVAALMAALTIPTLTLWSWTPVIGIIMGVNEVILLRGRQAAPVDPPTA